MGYYGNIRPHGLSQGELVQMLWETVYYAINTVGATATTYFTVAIQCRHGDWTGLTTSDRRVTPNGFVQADFVQLLYEVIYALITVPLAGFTEADMTGRAANRILSTAGTPQYTGGTTTRNYIIERNGLNWPDVCQLLYEVVDEMIDLAVAADTWTLDVEDKTQNVAGVSG